MIQDAIDGTAHADDYTAETWKQVSAEAEGDSGLRQNVSATSSPLTLVDRGEVDGQRSYRYRVEFPKAIVLDHVVFDGQNKLASGGAEAMEWKPSAKAAEAPSDAMAGIGVVLGAEGEVHYYKRYRPGLARRRAKGHPRRGPDRGRRSGQRAGGPGSKWAPRPSGNFNSRPEGHNGSSDDCSFWRR